MDEDFNSQINSGNADEAGGSLAGELDELLEGRFASESPSAPSPRVEHVIGRPFLVRKHSPSSCPAPEDLLALLEGDSVDPSVHHSSALTQSGLDQSGFDQLRRDALRAHIAECSDCAASAHLYLAELSDDENALIAELESSKQEGIALLASRLAKTPHASRKKSPLRSILWLGVGLAACLLIAASFIGWKMRSDPSRLLAQAYGESRVFDLRIPGAKFAEVSPRLHLRGGAEQDSKALRDARTKIEQRLEVSPNDRSLIQLKARADLIDERFDDAIAALDPLVAAGSPSASVLLDDASAYFARGVATDSESDRSKALDRLRKADEIAPADPVILFNEALALEDRGELINAVETWNRYLRFERDSSWQAEGRQRLAALEQKLKLMNAGRP